ncbi:phosphonate ABC transporter, ATP-binding protein PhnC [Clostridium aceticum]|uniref:Phosphonate ABC transporter, ATP-binding protein PhnC n=1 Tax=Clostridium aceticum TaxID=84022 RepID=A0A0D8IDR5_9CLOT|nr:phosphonate ABC transporter ATP-binding protein [Clostridium aceticum]AKL94213.1 phosphonate ABC transporter, ATP-binding protein PhnC [Clostridium aceticum]KJF28450.1 phosphonate ABC transporter ATP-binding protein [Clostridium aceticum]
MQLIIKDLKKHYNKKETFALDHVNLHIDQGEFISILGLSGSGKSTFIRCLNRLIDPTEGEIYFEGQEITKLRGEALRLYRRNLAMIFQHYNLIPRMKVLTNVLVGRFGYLSPLQILLKQFPKEDVEKANEALQKVGLLSFAERPIKTLSGGQQQRVGIARALIQQPKIILGDEPVSSLDPVTAKEIMLLLKEINENRKITMMINLHSVELAKTFSTRIIGLNNGSIVFDGPPSALDEVEINRIYR